MENIKWIIAGVITLASLITAITVIVKAVRQTTQAGKDNIKNLARTVVVEEIKKLNDTHTMLFQQMRESFYRTIDESFKVISHEIKEMRTDFNTFMEQQNLKNSTLAHGHIETWKKDIRKVYFKLRNTGEITDHDKAYVDKIYHVYKELGGNSDIDAKYKEICDVYALKTMEIHKELLGKSTKKKVLLEVGDKVE